MFPRRAALALGDFVARQETPKALTTVPKGNAGCASPDAQKSGSGLSRLFGIMKQKEIETQKIELVGQAPFVES